MRNAISIAASTTHAAPALDKYNDFELMAINDAGRMPAASTMTATSTAGRYYSAMRALVNPLR